MTKTLAASVLCAAALLIGCASTPEQTDVSPGALDGSKASCQSATACSPAACPKTSCPSAAKAAEATASPGAVADTKAKSCCPSSKADAGKSCSAEAAKQCPSMKAAEDATVSPGAFGGTVCCPPCPPCPKCPAHPDGCPQPCPPCPPGRCK